jgi:hypothetical protein
MYNDEIMILYLIIAIYHLKSPYLSALFISLSLSVKAGAILILPAFLGQIQYNYGLKKLTGVLVFMVSFQAILALPFVAWGDTSVRKYLFYSKFSLEGRGGIGGSLPLYDYMASNHDSTIFWRFIPKEIYEVKELLADRLKLGVILTNIFHFFIRKNCTM